jgi:hypothetical protein
MTINLLPFNEDIEVMRSYNLLEITLISSYGVTMPNTTPNQIPSQSATLPILHNMKPYEISRQRCNDL